jgi:hypothetical protein
MRLLEFNGSNWELYPSPNETIVRSVLEINKVAIWNLVLDPTVKWQIKVYITGIETMEFDDEHFGTY